jgi:putative endopeptidase
MIRISTAFLARTALGIALASAAALPAHAAGEVRPVAERPVTMPKSMDPLTRNMDPTVKPGDDFFKYACGGWIKRNPIPAAERGWGIGNLIYEETYRQRRGIAEAAAKAHAPHGSVDQRVGDYWTAGMDSAGIEKAGGAPMKPYLAEIAALKTKADVLGAIAKFHAQGVGPLYSFYIGQDERDSEHYLVHLYQGGLDMPDRDYYFATDAGTKKIREAYKLHIAAMFKLMGSTPAAAAKASAAVMRIETALAERSRTLEALRDPWANYHKMSIGELNKLTPSIDWKQHFADMGITKVDTVIAMQPEFLVRADSALTAIPVEDWKTYLRWNLVGSMASHMSHAFDWENFHFYGTVMNGTTAQRPRWKRVVDSEENDVGELLGMAWVKKYCSPATKARYEKLTEDIISTYRDRIRELPWMSEATKVRAIKKLDKVSRKVGYPDHWRDYSTLDFGGGQSYAANAVTIRKWWFKHEADKLGKPIDRTEWDMTPQTYNAYYDGSKVEIVLPAAAFMIPGVPDSMVDDALLYSYAGGSTIGHEITHGFDDQGRQSDENGNLNPWWTEQDSVQFTQRAKKLSDEFDAFVVGDKHVRGQATLGENIADLGGIKLGYEAFKKTDQYKSGKSINGFTPDQRYFLGYALSWLGQRRPQALAQQIMTDVHAPGFLRVNGPLANMPEFYAAFGIKEGDAMWRPDSVRAVIW